MGTLFENRMSRFVGEGWPARQANWEAWLADSILFAVTAANVRKGNPDPRVDSVVEAFGNALMRRAMGRVEPSATFAQGAVVLTEMVTQITAQLLAVGKLYEHMKSVVDAAKTGGG